MLKQKERESQKISEISTKERDLRNGGVLSPERIRASGSKVKVLSMRFDSRASSEDEGDRVPAVLNADIQRILSLAQKLSYPGINSLSRYDGDAFPINVSDSSGDTLLHFAAQLGNDELVRLVVNHGIDLNACNAEGRTALHLAFACGHDGLAEYLTGAGADDSILDADSLSCYDIAGTLVL